MFNFEHNIFLIIKNKETLIWYCKTSFLVVIFLNGKTENYVNFLSIIVTFSLSASRCRYCCWHIIIIFGVSDLAPRRQSRRLWRLVIIIVSLLSAAVSLLVVASVGFCASFLQRRRHPNQN